MKPEVSVIMPVYNMESYLKEAVGSILQQSFENFELIVVDDSSTDRSWDVLCTYYDSRLVCLRNIENIGNYPSRNKGMRVAKGKYICVMDADDIAFPDRIEKQFEYMELHPAVLACGSQFICIGMGNTYPKPLKYQDIQLQLLKDNRFLHPSLFIRTAVLKELGGYDERYRYSSDYDLACRLALRGEIVNMPDVLMQYRIHNTQISSAYRLAQKQYAREIRQKYQLEMIRRFKSLENDMPESEDIQYPVIGEIIFYCHCGKLLNSGFWSKIAEKLAYKLLEHIKSLPIEQQQFVMNEMKSGLCYLQRNGFIQDILGLYDKQNREIKQNAEITFWESEIQSYLAWYNGNLPTLYNTPCPSLEQKVTGDNLLQSAILTWTELHQIPKYLDDLGVDSSCFHEMKVLDVGCGPIPSATCFEKADIYGVDPLISNYEKAGFPLSLYPNVHFIESGAEDIPVEDHFFDVILSVNAIDHVDDLEKVARELRRVAKPDCKFLMHVHYHKATVPEPVEINDSIFSDLFGWVNGIKVKKRSRYSFTSIAREGEEFVLWSNM